MGGGGASEGRVTGGTSEEGCFSFREDNHSHFVVGLIHISNLPPSTSSLRASIDLILGLFILSDKIL